MYTKIAAALTIASTLIGAASVTQDVRGQRLKEFFAGNHVYQPVVQGTSSTARVTQRTIKIVGFGALTGPARSFGTNSRAALQAAADSINRSGGIPLAGGATGRIQVSYLDDHCDTTDGIAIVRQAAASDALVAVGPSCSSVAEALYHSLQRTVGDSSDGGIQMPVFTDGAMKADLAQLSQWAFRNSANETDMYGVLWAWVRRHDPEIRTVYGGEEADFAHSHSTWQHIISQQASEAGLTVVGQTGWSITDIAFVEQVARMKAARADVIVIAAHPTTTCGVLREMQRQNVRPRLVVGLTSSSTEETLKSCGRIAEGLLIPTSFVPIGQRARMAAAAVVHAGGVADMHSMSAWEVMFALAHVIRQNGILGAQETVVADRRKLREGLARMTTMDGLLGPIERTVDREARKPFVLVRAHHDIWQVVFRPQ